MVEFTWVSTDARTGVVLAELPDLVVERVRQSIGRYESAMASLPLPTAPENWLRATMPGAVNLILLADGVPVWGGMVTRRPRTEGDTVEMSLSTLEAYFDRRFVGDETFAGVGQNVIVETLVDKYAAEGGRPGIPIRVQYTGAGVARDRTYKDLEDKSLYSVLQELMGVDGGPEWVVSWEWQHNPERVTPVLFVGDRVGSAAPVGLSPAAVFEIPGPVSSFEFDEDYSSGRGANDVMAVSTAEADVRPQSPRQVSSDGLRPTFEFRFTPSTTVSDVGTLAGHALAALGLLADGTVSVSLSVAAAKAARLGVDWFIGDDVGFVIGGLVSPEPRMRFSGDLFVDEFTDRFGASGSSLVRGELVDSVPAFPGGLTGVARAIGFELSLGSNPMVTPILAGSSLRE